MTTQRAISLVADALNLANEMGPNHGYGTDEQHLAIAHTLVMAEIVDKLEELDDRLERLTEILGKEGEPE